MYRYLTLFTIELIIDFWLITLFHWYGLVSTLNTVWTFFRVDSQKMRKLWRIQMKQKLILFHFVFLIFKFFVDCEVLFIYNFFKMIFEVN